MTTLIVDVEPNVIGTVGSLQPNFAYSKGPGSTCKTCEVFKGGDIELGSCLTNWGVDIQFVLKPDSIEIGGIKYTAKLDKNALTIVKKCTDPECLKPGQPSALTKLTKDSVHSPNSNSDIHKYSLEVTLTGQGPALSVKHDPKIKNGGFGIELTATTIAVALAVTALAAFIGFKLGARRMKMAASAPKPDSYR